jgi:hypothetical protein
MTDTPSWVTLVAAGSVLVGTGLTAWSAWKAAKAASAAARSAALLETSATKFVARSDRFAKWQMHKRDVYAQLLSSVRDFHAAPGREKKAARKIMEQKFDAAYFVASSDLTDHLDELYRLATAAAAGNMSSEKLVHKLRSYKAQMVNDVKSKPVTRRIDAETTVDSDEVLVDAPGKPVLDRGEPGRKGPGFPPAP